MSVGVRGILGADWRVHKHFSLFAEYGLGVTLANSTRTRTSTITEVDIGDEVVTTEITSDGSQTAVFDTATALVQGAALGVIMHF